MEIVNAYNITKYMKLQKELNGNTCKPQGFMKVHKVTQEDIQRHLLNKMENKNIYTCLRQQQNTAKCMS